MPLLNPSNTTPAQAALNRIVSLTQSGFNQRLATWQMVMSALWKAPDPQAVIDLMGTDAKNNFAASAAEGAALAQLSGLLFDPTTHAANLQRIEQISSVVKPYTVNDDGTVTVTATPPAV